MTTPNTIQLHQHGMVRLLNLAGPTRRPGTWGEDGSGDAMSSFSVRDFDADDVDPAQAARMSFAQFDSERTYEQDMKLNEYLLLNQHSSPFEMVQVWLEVKVPIFIDRQLVRHRTWRRNESSGRYIVLPDTWYIPEVVGGKAPNKKQGQADNLDAATQQWFKEELGRMCERDYNFYLSAIKAGVAPEHARMALHLNHYVHWLGNVDLHNLFHFLRLRAHSHAQIEARAYAEAIVELLRPYLPGLIALFDKHCRRPE